MSLTDNDYASNNGASTARKLANGAVETVAAEVETNVERFDEARAKLKARASEIRKAAAERLEQARVKAGELAHTAGEKATAAGKGAVTHAKAHPVQTALIGAAAVGAAIGVAIAVRNNRSRHIAATTAKHFWSDYGKILLPLATALAVPTKAVADEAPRLADRASKFASSLSPRIAKYLH